MNKPIQTPVAVITGASSGIGREAAKTLIKGGWTVIGIGRDPGRCEQARDEIQREAADGGQVVMLCADLALMAEVNRVADDIASITDKVNILLNNAGGMARERIITAEGNENTFAGNHLGHFLLAKRLLPLLRAAATGAPGGATRIVNVSSAAHGYCDGFDWDDLQMIDSFHPGLAYMRAKLANVLFTRELSRRLSGDGIVVHAMHPGIVGSNFINHADDATQSALKAKEDQWVSPRAAGDDLVWLATAPEAAATSGDYFYQRTVVPISPAALDDAAASRLWQESERLVARFNRAQ